MVTYSLADAPWRNCPDPWRVILCNVFQNCGEEMYTLQKIWKQTRLNSMQRSPSASACGEVRNFQRGAFLGARKYLKITIPFTTDIIIAPATTSVSSLS